MSIAWYYHSSTTQLYHNNLVVKIIICFFRKKVFRERFLEVWTKLNKWLLKKQMVKPSLIILDTLFFKKDYSILRLFPMITEA